MAPSPMVSIRFQYWSTARTEIVNPGWTAPFRVEKWDMTKDVPYRVRHSGGAVYEGIIRVRGEDHFSNALSRVLHHELVHAALHAADRSAVYPGWFNEGLAEWFEARARGKRRLDSWELSVLSRAHGAGRLLSFEALSVPSFGRMSPDAARLAYLQSYGLMEYLGRRHGERALREFCVELVRTGDLRRTLRRVYRADLSTLEAGFVSDLG